MRRLLARLLWRLTPPEPFMVFEEIARYGDQIVAMCQCQGDLFIATKHGTMYRVKEFYL